MPPRWGQVQQFCEIQGYKRSETDHTHFSKPLPDRTTPGTMISHGKDGQTITPSTWQRVWKHQLRLLSEDEFWKGLEGEPVQYDVSPTLEVPQFLPDYLQLFLRDKLHYDGGQIARLSRDEAQVLMDEYYRREILDA